MDDPLSLVSHFSNMKDPRISRARRHNLIDILVISICAVVCGAETWDEIMEFGQAKERWLRTFLELPNGIPSHDTFARIFARLCPGPFQECFSLWMKEVMEISKGKLIAVDGKTIRRSFDTALGQNPLHMVSAWSSANHLVLGQIKVEGHENEITAIPKLLEILDIAGCTVSIDAIGAQKSIAGQIIAQGGEYVLGLKGNQPTLFQEVDAVCGGAMPEILSGRFGKCLETVDGDHGRIETRKYWLISDPSIFETAAFWPGLKGIGIVDRKSEKKGSVSEERRYFLLSNDDLHWLMGAVRNHWSIENGLHWTLDVSFREDISRIRKDNAPENFAWLRRMALTLLKRTRSTEYSKRYKRVIQQRLSVKTKRLKSGWDENFLLKVLFGDSDSTESRSTGDRA